MTSRSRRKRRITAPNPDFSRTHHLLTFAGPPEVPLQPARRGWRRPVMAPGYERSMQCAAALLIGLLRVWHFGPSCIASDRAAGVWSVRESAPAAAGEAPERLQVTVSPRQALAWRPAGTVDPSCFGDNGTTRQRLPESDNSSHRAGEVASDETARRIARQMTIHQAALSRKGRGASPTSDIPASANPHHDPFDDRPTKLETGVRANPWSEDEARPLERSSGVSGIHASDPFGDGVGSPWDLAEGARGPQTTTEAATQPKRRSPQVVASPLVIRATEESPPFQLEAGDLSRDSQKPSGDATRCSEHARASALRQASHDASEIELHGPGEGFVIPRQLQLEQFANPFRSAAAAQPLTDEDAAGPDWGLSQDGSAIPPQPEEMLDNDLLPSVPDSMAPRAVPDLAEPPLPEGYDPLGEPVPPAVDESLPDGSQFPDRVTPRDPAPREESLSPEPQRGEFQSAGPVPCDRIYNDRNCCEGEQNCREAWARFRETRIEDISISIAPPLVPLAEDEAEVEEQRGRLANSPSRPWRNRTGKVVATGQMVDLVHGDVIVRDPSGVSVELPVMELSQDDLCFASAWWRIPTECLIEDEPLQVRDWTKTTFTWKAAGVCHKPLYFEDVQLERYGHSAGPFLQPVISGAHFFGNIFLLPYNMGVYPPNECRYALGYYRPGSCAPWLVPAFPLSRRGATFQTAAVLGIWGILK